MRPLDPQVLATLQQAARLQIHQSPSKMGSVVVSRGAVGPAPTTVGGTAVAATEVAVTVVGATVAGAAINEWGRVSCSSARVPTKARCAGPSRNSSGRPGAVVNLRSEAISL